MDDMGLIDDDFNTVVACSLTHNEIMEHWKWIEKNLMTTLSSFDDEDQVTDFVKCKIESLVAHAQPAVCGPAEGILIASHSFLVQCYAWSGHICVFLIFLRKCNCVLLDL